ncbi:exopolysaccharide biosynthesis polyprenyl glycosylphosphotransferase [Empedobacter brevis]|uniref:exopolysaccharide biosynthesis polyprenyl glycosylphosphotransferase n=1 Tax=Empedobacter brevis TaxID=247 RepID=UPI003341CA67
MKIFRNNYNLFQFLNDIFYITILFLLHHNNEENLIKKTTLTETSFYSFIITSWIICSVYNSIYSLQRHHSFIYVLKSLLFQICFFTLSIIIFLGFFDYEFFDYRNLLLFIFNLTIVLFFSRIVLFIYFKKIHIKGINLIKVMIIDSNHNTHQYIDSIEERKDFGYIIEDIFIHSIDECDTIDYIKNKFLVEKYTIFYSLNGSYSTDFKNKIYNLSQDYYNNLFFIPDQIYNDATIVSFEEINSLPLINLNIHPLKKEFNQILKRLFDILFSSLVCVFILSWLFPIIALLIKLDSKGPIIFKQKRRGLNGKEFDCFKFRTMRNDGTNSIKATVVNDNRITRIGNFLRKTSIDELPQFFNVLNGDMSIVGPRPHMISQDMYYSEIIRKYNLRNYVKPGITGLAQVKGYRGAIDCDKDMEDRIRTDIFYVRNWSILLDIQIIYQTVVLVFKGDENAI